MSDFFNRIYEAVKAIPTGTVATYGFIAAKAGNPHASRAVGWALHNNPDPENIPCHRVVMKDGSLSKAFAFGGENEQKRLLLSEGVPFDGDKVALKSLFDGYTLQKQPVILSIETSCDETAAALTRGREVISDAINTQIEIHKKYGGVVPEIASRNHILNIDTVVKEVLLKGNMTFADVDYIAVTQGAGLLGALLVGVSYTKGLAYALNKPLIPVNHLKGHIAASYITASDLQPPFVTLLVSGGHTQILRVNSWRDIAILGETQDDAAGEAFDKVARLLGLPYPGGPEIEKAALKGTANIKLPRAFKGEDTLNFSFSGLKTAVMTLLKKDKTINANDLAASFQSEVCSVLLDNTFAALKKEGLNTLTLAGGVSANGALRTAATERARKENIHLILPEKRHSTDN
ncbi:MAG: tRNA (adenosine(37)-N6)-threonylcarbamoyltransferase complex transferase subunit TsaD, partial [Christensenellaceae bacterium]|nr:tRNA (adenosine(37)-N6)-threonylcarbamoyltransferase complex transferase subunit TsaD [Christensenellaceae bacterium]